MLKSVNNFDQSVAPRVSWFSSEDIFVLSETGMTRLTYDPVILKYTDQNQSWNTEHIIECSHLERNALQKWH